MSEYQVLARKYRPALFSEVLGQEAIVTIEDHGIGIPAKRQSRIFERFYRAHSGTDQDYGGLGVGLYISRYLVQQLGGRMWFLSAEGGSRFMFSLPLAEEEAEAEAEGSS